MLTMTTAEVEVLATARRLLHDIERRCEKEYAEMPANELVEFDRPDAMDYGRLAEAAQRAEDSVFNVLNVAKNYVRVPLTDEQMRLQA